MSTPALTEPWTLGPLKVPNRVLLAPLAGIGNWFVRLQAKRYGAGMAFSEMVSSQAISHGNARTLGEMLRIDPRERAPGAGEAAAGADGGPVSIQLFGEDPATMRTAACHVAGIGADAIDINMGCPVPKVARTGAGAALLADPDRAVALARAAREGAEEALADGAPGRALAAGAAVGAAGPGGSAIPVTVKLRSGLRVGETSGFELAHRLVEEAGVAAIAFHPRSAAVHHRGVPDYALAGRLVRSLPAPVILTGGLSDAAHVREAFAETGAAAVMLARGALGNPWLFAELLHGRERAPHAEEVLAELRWTCDRAVEHLGPERATRYVRKFYPWYLARLGLRRAESAALLGALQRAQSLQEAGELLARGVGDRVAVAV